jgi:16S rRNA (guanine966-N2)-methyltransferase
MTHPKVRRAGGAREGSRWIGAGRVVAGSVRGIRLVGPADGVRPLGDRLKQALFAILEPTLRGAAFLDLFAGTGAAGIEALSRGAASVTFVETDALAIESIARNLAATHLAGPAVSVVRADALAWLGGRGADRTFDVVFVDPPYDRPELPGAALERLAAAGPNGVLAAAGVVVAKHQARTSLPARIGLLASTRERRFGESALAFYRWSDGEAG